MSGDVVAERVILLYVGAKSTYKDSSHRSFSPASRIALLMRVMRVVAVALVITTIPVSPVSATPIADGPCKRLGREQATALGALRCERVKGSLRWKLVKPVAGVKVIDGLPFERTLPAGLTAQEVAFRFAKDWTALMACLDWGPDNHNDTGKNELGPVTSKCNKAVWGTKNAFIDWYVRGKLSDEGYYGPVTALWQKYESYGVLLRHPECPESGPFEILCTGFPRGYSGWYEGRTFTHHFFYKRMRVTYAGETWYVHNIDGPQSIDFVLRMIDPSNPEYSPRGAAQFAWTPVVASYWEYPGCRMLGRETWDDSGRTCEVYWAFRDLSGRP